MLVAARDLLYTGEDVRHILDSTNTMHHYDDDAFVEEAFSGCFAVICDLEMGIYCHVEYDK